LQILNAVLERWWLVREAAEVLGVSERHVWRILAAYRKEGAAAALSHGNRGRHPANTTPGGVKQRVVSVVRERYLGINHTHPHLTELLAEREGIVLSRSTVRRLLVGGRTAQFASPLRAAPQVPAPKDAAGGDAASARRQPPLMAGGPGADAYHAAGGGRRHRYGSLRPLQRPRGIPGVTSSCSRASYGGVVYRLRCIPTATPSSSAVTGRRTSPS
jgi:transposase